RERQHVADGAGVVGGEDLDRLQAVGREAGGAGEGRDLEVAGGVGPARRVVRRGDLGGIETADDPRGGGVGHVPDAGPGGVVEAGDGAEAHDRRRGGGDDLGAVVRRPVDVGGVDLQGGGEDQRGEPDPISSVPVGAG